MKPNKTLAIVIVISLFFGVVGLDFAKADFSATGVAYSFRYPMDNYTRFSLENFGENRGSGVWHLGNDISGPAGTPIFSIADGIVRHTGVHTRFGMVVLVEHTLPDTSKVVSLYGHLRESDVAVKEGQVVSIGDTLGYLGTRAENGGWGEHLHLGIRKGGYVDVDSRWVYYGLGERALLNEWHDPTPFIESHMQIADPGKRILTGAGPIGSTHLRSFYISGEIAETDSRVLDRSAIGGADVAAGDIDGDGHEEIIFGAGPGWKPEVSVRNQNNEEISIFLAYAEAFKGGIRVAAGDVDGDGEDEIVTAPRKGGGGQVSIFEADGTRRSLEFWPYGPHFRGGVDVAVGQADASTSKEEIIVAPESGYKPLVKVYEPHWGNDVYSEFLAFAETFPGGVRLATGDVDLDGTEEIVVGSADMGGHVRVLEPKDGGPRGIDYFPFGPSFRSGIDVGTNDFNNDGKVEIIVGSGGRSTADVKVYRYNVQREIMADFWPYGSDFDGGCNVSGITF